MCDIFLSHSSLDRDIVEKVCDRLESAGFNCWVSYRIKDLQPGKIYTKRITEAIDSCKVFILLLSNHSLASEQVLQEVISANERQRYGLKMFVAFINEDIDMNQFHLNMGYVFAGKEMFYWGDTIAQEELIKEIGAFLNAGSISDTAKILSYVPDAGQLIGRDNEIATITVALQKSGKVWINGMGGIGKTALLVSYCRNMLKTESTTVIYLPLEKCVARTLDNDNHLTLVNECIAEKRLTLTNYQYALYKLSVLENSVNEKMLIVIDNVEDINDPLLERICNLNCKIIIASRYSKILPGFELITIREINQCESMHELFELYYGKKIKTEEYAALDDLLAGVRFHTMTVVLIAKQMNYFGKRPSDYRDRNQLAVERANNLAQLMTGTMADHVIAEMYLQLFDLFDASTLTKQEKIVMKTLCLLPMEGTYRHLYLSLLGNEYLDAIIKLEKIGWVQNDIDKKYIFLHPLVRDVVLHELDIFLDDPDISVFFTNFILSISDCWNKKYEENLQYKEIALAIYFQFPQPTINRYKEYLDISKLLWVLNYMDISVELQNKVKNLFIRTNGGHVYTSEEAEALLQIGFTYQSKGDYLNAVEELSSSVRIFGNKYCAALSHLAQAKMSTHDNNIDSIEPLLQESLAIRERYWKDTLSEAASCHLYAKVLSSYNLKLDYAMKLEKKAYQIFSKLQPKGVNVSSAAYMLGWLFVQNAENIDDIKFGIKKLEEAKSIRINYRGDSLHPWMEDIYLKLGQAYERYGDNNKALEYYKLLLNVRLKKYKNENSNFYIIEVYELLLNIYKLLDDKAGQSRCQSYLKYCI